MFPGHATRLFPNLRQVKRQSTSEALKSQGPTTFHGGSGALHGLCIPEKAFRRPIVTSVSLRDSKHRVPLTNDMVYVPVMFHLYRGHCPRILQAPSAVSFASGSVFLAFRVPKGQTAFRLAPSPVLSSLSRQPSIGTLDYTRIEAPFLCRESIVCQEAGMNSSRGGCVHFTLPFDR